MPRSLNVSLPETMREFVDAQASDEGLYATPSEYLRSLVRQDMASQGTITHVMSSLDEARKGQFSKSSILDILNED